jgi:hypothetical protein
MKAAFADSASRRSRRMSRQTKVASVNAAAAQPSTSADRTHAGQGAAPAAVIGLTAGSRR